MALVVVAVGVAAAGSSGRAAPWWREWRMHHPPGGLNVLLVTLDTTRADHLGVYGAAQAETPALDALARRGVLFRQAYSHVPLTFPSHSSIMTGLLPTRHGMRDNGATVLSEALPVLAERFRDAGYHTGAFVSAFVLDRRFGLARGFERYEDDVPGADAAQAGDPSERAVRAEDTVTRALTWLADADGRPRFLWVHLFDPHAPYEPPEPFKSRHAGQPYDGEIAYMDAQVGRLLDAANASGHPWLTVVAGDHGEGLGDHQEITHGYFIYGNTQHVPLLMSLPGRVPAGRSVDGIVRLVDVAPTTLALADLPPLPAGDGRSLVPFMAGRETGSAGPAYAESYHPRLWWGAQELRALRTDQWLFVESPRPELYDLGADPNERTDLSASRRQVIAELRGQLKVFEAATAADAAPVRLDPTAEARLRSLGYVSAGRAADPAGTALPDAKDNGPLLAAMTEGHELAVQGRHQEALAKFAAALAMNPQAVTARTRVAESLLLLGRFDEAFAAFGDLATHGGAIDAAYLGMSQARQAKGDADAALEVARAGLDAAPSSVALAVRVGDLLAGRQQFAEAERSYRAALALTPRDEAARWGLGAALLKLGRRDESVATLLALAEDSPRSPQGRLAGLAILQWADERLAAKAPADARRAYEAAIGAGHGGAVAFLNLALATFEAAGPAEALAVLDRGVARFPDSPDLQYRRGRVLQQLGRQAEADAALHTVLRLAPGHDGAKAALGRR